MTTASVVVAGTGIDSSTDADVVASVVMVSGVLSSVVLVSVVLSSVVASVVAPGIDSSTDADVVASVVMVSVVFSSVVLVSVVLSSMVASVVVPDVVASVVMVSVVFSSVVLVSVVGCCCARKYACQVFLLCPLPQRGVALHPTHLVCVYITALLFMCPCGHGRPLWIDMRKKGGECVCVT